MNDVFILAAQRTAIGSFQGAFANIPAPKMGAHVIQAALKQAQLNTQDVQECIMGEVLTAGVGQAPARQAAIYAGLPTSTQCMTINKVCGSGLKAVMLAADNIRLGNTELAVAGGQENMSLAPHLLENVRAGYRLGHMQTTDSLIKDGLWDPYNNWHMGNAAELCVREYKFSRAEQDAFAKESYVRAQKAIADGKFRDEISPFEQTQKGSTTRIDTDEEPSKARFDKMGELRPAFEKEGTITAANASKINDGAAALILSKNAKGAKARIVSYATFAQDPKWFTTAPIGAMKEALKGAQLKAEQIDLYEINEAFSAVTMVAMKDLAIPHAKVNVHGGAVALGHPIGASGARLLTTLLYSLQHTNKKYGLATLCIGGGEAVAMVIERL